MFYRACEISVNTRKRFLLFALHFPAAFAILTLLSRGGSKPWPIRGGKTLT